MTGLVLPRATMSGLFIAGTDTGAGKTLVTGLLAAHCARRGLDVVTQKWVQTGARPGQGDLDAHRRFGLGASTSSRKFREPYRFPLAASPHLAARAAGTVISPYRLAAAYRTLTLEHHLVLVEGTGGLMVPLTTRVLQFDLVRELRLPVLLVVANRLGCINHTLLTLAALRARKMRVLGLVFTAPAPGAPRVLADNVRCLAAFDRAPVLGVLPFRRSTHSLPKLFAPCGDAILRLIRH